MIAWINQRSRVNSGNEERHLYLSRELCNLRHTLWKAVKFLGIFFRSGSDNKAAEGQICVSSVSKEPWDAVAPFFFHPFLTSLRLSMSCELDRAG